MGIIISPSNRDYRIIMHSVCYFMLETPFIYPILWSKYCYVVAAVSQWVWVNDFSICHAMQKTQNVNCVGICRLRTVLDPAPLPGHLPHYHRACRYPWLVHPLPMYKLNRPVILLATLSIVLDGGVGAKWQQSDELQPLLLLSPGHGVSIAGSTPVYPIFYFRFLFLTQ